MKRLIHIDVIRTIAILFVVFIHTFILYNNYLGTFKKHVIFNSQYTDLVYNFLNALMIPSLTLIAGYTFTFIQEKRKQPFDLMIKSKIKRLIIPTIIFGIIYTFLFQEFEIKLRSIVVIIISGVGHLWYLPALFWMFIMGYYLEKYYHKMNNSFVLFISFIISLLIYGAPKTFGLAFSISLLPYFFIGILFWKNKELINKRLVNTKSILILSATYITIYILYITILFTNLNNILPQWFIHTMNVILRTSGSIAFFIIIAAAIKNNINKHFNILVKYCFGIYIFHLFILKILISSFRFESLFNEYIGFIILFLTTTIISLIVSILFQKTKIGKFLLE